ncbi:MAG: hypothetical protein LBU27_07815 [Candidatus Peribacteria bacterium]|jgi:branched-subunit amino acid ABC-type transport system permease component|nr:hypothetical protein [Candidatus Peribacteria bacterium]
MDFNYLLLNTILYGGLALAFSVFFSSGKIMNFALGNYLIICAYILYAFLTHGFNRLTVIVLIAFILLYRFVHWLLLRYFPNDKQRDLVGLVFTLGLAVVLENAMHYLY